MKKSMLILACALITPIAFAQTSTTTTEKTTTTAPTRRTERTTTVPTTKTETTTTYSAGTVTTYEPGKTIVVRGAEGPADFVLGTAARILHGPGKTGTDP